MDRLYGVLGVVILLWIGGGARVTHGQAGERTPRKGVVWTPPSSSAAAQEALRTMHAGGVTAVRLPGPVDDSALLALADSLGLALYVDLPVAHLSARALADSTALARRMLERVLAQAQRHASIRAVGLARGVDTTTPRTCSYFESMDRGADGEPDLQTYYVTPFGPAVDACAGFVDTVLLDVVDAPDPLARWHAWRQAHASVGLGAVGRGVRPGAAGGLRVSGSPERQARYLEQVLPPLLDRAASSALFVYRWRDRRPGSTLRHYGLHAENGTRRPAARVVEGIFAGRQATFAFPQGTPSAPGAPWLLVIGWGLVAGLAGLYAHYGQVRRTLARYFLSRGFYHDSIRRGRDLLPDVSIVLLLTAVCALSIGAIVMMRAIRAEPAVRHVLDVFPSGLQAVMARWMTAPVTYGVEVGVGGGLLLVAWGLGLGAAARPWKGVTSSQLLMLLAWPHWPALIGMAAALVVAAGGVNVRGWTVAAVLAGGGFVLAVSSTIRVLRDYVAVAGVPASVACLLALASPPAVVLFGTGIIVLHYDLPLRFLYRLITLT